MEPNTDLTPLEKLYMNEGFFMAMDLPAPLESEYQEIAWGLKEYESKHTRMLISRPKVGELQVKVELKYCGICHSDAHVGLNQCGGCKYPAVTGHESCGTVVEVGAKVTKVKVGDNVGIGVIHDSCMECTCCGEGDEQYCEKGVVEAYDSYKDQGYESHIGGNMEVHTLGGYSGSFVVHERFVIKVPDNLPLEAVGPLMCAGITMYDPMRQWGATAGKQMTIGIAGIGGLGTMGIKIAKALGHRVVAISSTTSKAESAKQKGADAFVVSTDGKSMYAENGKIDLLLNTISAPHQLAHYMPLLKNTGTIVQLGLVTEPHQVNQMEMLGSRKKITTSFIGGIKATEELLELCSQKNILPDIQLVEAKEIDWCWQQLCTTNKDGVRYVLDIAKSKQNKDFMPQK